MERANSRSGRVEKDAQLERIKGEESRADGAAAEIAGAQAVDACGTSLGAAASGTQPNVDMEEARLRLRDVQTALAAMGYRMGHDDPADGIDGVWGPATRDAIAAFQEDHDLETTGQVDGDTYAAILAAYDDGLGVQAAAQRQDDFSPIRAEEPLADAPLDLSMEGDDQDPDDSSADISDLRPGPVSR